MNELGRQKRQDGNYQKGVDTDIKNMNADRQTP